MKLIHPSHTIYAQPMTLDDVYEAIERAGRTCYKSERPEGKTAKDFVTMLIKAKHYAMLEHGTIYLKTNDILTRDRYAYNDYSRVNKFVFAVEDGIDEDYYITTNLRVIIENGWLEDLKNLHIPTDHHDKRITVRFITDRGVSHELVRHRKFSFAQESTRYCNYSKERFGNEVTYIIPSWLPDIKEDTYGTRPIYDGVLGYSRQGAVGDTTHDVWHFTESEGRFIFDCIVNEEQYMNLLRIGRTPQEARAVLSNALKTEIVMTGFEDDWKHFFELRTSVLASTGQPHPDMAALIDPLYREWDLIES